MTAGVKFAGDGEDGVADLFGVKSFAVGAPVKAVAGILGERRRVVLGGELIDGAEHDFAVELFGRHPVLDEVGSQVFEEFGISGAFAGEAEIAGRFDEASTEVTLPDAVDEDAHGDGLFADGFG